MRIPSVPPVRQVCRVSQRRLGMVARLTRSLSMTHVIDAVVPRHRFGTSVYTTPALLVLRLFYGVAPFRELKAFVHDETVFCRDDTPLRRACDSKGSIRLPSACVQDQMSSNMVQSIDAHPNENVADLFREPRQWTSESFLEVLGSSSASAMAVSNYKLISLTWVKALGSHLSHGYVQFVVEESSRHSGQPYRRYRLVVDRQDSADYIFTGYEDQYALGVEPTSHNTLPLPLLSWSFDHLAPSQRPTLLDVVNVVAQTSRARPEYDALRYNCWWFAETIFEQLGRVFAEIQSEIGKHKEGGRLLEWEFAHLRYAMISRDQRWMKRRKLAKVAEEFRQMNARMMLF